MAPGEALFEFIGGRAPSTEVLRRTVLKVVDLAGTWRIGEGGGQGKEVAGEQILGWADLGDFGSPLLGIRRRLRDLVWQPWLPGIC